MGAISAIIGVVGLMGLLSIGIVLMTSFMAVANGMPVQSYGLSLTLMAVFCSLLTMGGFAGTIAIAFIVFKRQNKNGKPNWNANPKEISAILKDIFQSISGRKF